MHFKWFVDAILQLNCETNYMQHKCNLSRVVELCISFHICSADRFTYVVLGILNKAFNPLDKWSVNRSKDQFNFSSIYVFHRSIVDWIVDMIYIIITCVYGLQYTNIHVDKWINYIQTLRGTKDAPVYFTVDHVSPIEPQLYRPCIDKRDTVLC